ncbi:uncharacterized protein [Henckelia pumila]|uniref:uncharacterized protein n=1 Tax=Henckelia pumila TaxID=405737 RepID=UPI003C6DCAF3
MASMKSNTCTAENRSFKCNGEVVRFVPISNYNNQESMESCESGFCSPPLWKNRPPKSPSPPQPLLGHHSYKCISPNSRLQAIVRSQFELMELVKTMPESSYELSLTDLVENPRSETRAPQPWGPDYNDRDLRRRSQESRKSDRITRSASFENKGLLLKMVFPVGLPSKRKKRLETEWWKKRFTASTDSDNSRTSGGGSDSIRKRNGVLGNCFWPLFQSSRRSESAE